MGKHKLIAGLLFLQGLFYGLTGAWGLISPASFMHFVRNTSDMFKTQSNAALFTVLGMMFIYSANKAWQKFAARLAIVAGLLLALVDLKFLMLSQTSSMFWYDLMEEVLMALLLLISLAIS